MSHNCKTSTSTYFYLSQRLPLSRIRIFYGYDGAYADVKDIACRFIVDGILHIPAAKDIRNMLFPLSHGQYKNHMFMYVVFNDKEMFTLNETEQMYIDIDIYDDDNIPTQYELVHVCEKLGFKVGVVLGAQRALFSWYNLANWRSCENYYMVDIWQQMTNYFDAANVDNIRQEDESIDFIYVNTRHDYFDCFKISSLRGLN